MARYAPMSFFLPTKPWTNFSSYGKVEVWKENFLAGPCVVCRSISPSPSSSRPLWLMGCKKPWIWAWPQLWASATTTPHSLSKYTTFWTRKAFLLPQIRYPPLLHYCESAAAFAVAALLYLLLLLMRKSAAVSLAPHVFTIIQHVQIKV